MKLYDTLSPQFAQAGINRLDIEDLLCVSFIIIDDMYKASVPQNIQHRRGPNSPFADSEVLAISWVGELMSVDSEKGWYSFVKKQFISTSSGNPIKVGFLFGGKPSKPLGNIMHNRIGRASDVGG